MRDGSSSSTNPNRVWWAGDTSTHLGYIEVLEWDANRAAAEVAAMPVSSAPNSRPHIAWFPVSKAFTKETDREDGEAEEPDPLPAQAKNYVTPAGMAALQEEFRKLLYDERPKVVETVSWAAQRRPFRE
jgi:hypothetical protein